MHSASEPLVPMPAHPNDLLRVQAFYAFEEADRRLLFVVANAAFVEADDAGWFLAQALGGASRGRLSELRGLLVAEFSEQVADETLATFAQLEILVPHDLPQIQPDVVPLTMDPLQSLVLHVAHDCNLRCGYCYADYGRYGEAEGMMSADMAVAHVEKFFDQLQDARRVHVTMFGGEPLMNLPVVYAAHAYAKDRAAREGRQITFSITTNGTLLTRELAEFFAAERFSVTVSIDGPPDVNDRLRPLQEGGGSYETIMRNVKASGVDAVARVTLTRKSLDVARIVRHLVDSGFREVGVSPVASSSFGIAGDDLDVVLDGLRALADDFVQWASRGEIFPFSNIRILVDQIAAGQPRKTPCGAGTALAAADNKGNWYACHRLVGQEQFHIGTLQEGVDSQKRLRLLTDMHPRGRAPCESCWARYLCGGGCHHIAWLHTEQGAAPWTIEDRFCDFLREWYRIGLYTYARVEQVAPELLGRSPARAACSQPLAL